jgi:hypothetical protein
VLGKQLSVITPVLAIEEKVPAWLPVNIADSRRVVECFVPERARQFAGPMTRAVAWRGIRN